MNRHQFFSGCARLEKIIQSCLAKGVPQKDMLFMIGWTAERAADVTKAKFADHLARIVLRQKSLRMSKLKATRSAARRGK